MSVGALHATHGQLLHPGAETYGVHTPVTQYSPGEQFFPHAPQLVMSLLRSTHPAGEPVAGQRVSVPEQPEPVVAVTHFAPPLPGMQTSVEAQAFPHAPQFAGSLLRFLHPRHPVAPPQGLSPPAHTGAPPAQASLWQTSLPHVPQFFGSVFRSVHNAPHTVPGHDAASIGVVSVLVESALVVLSVPDVSELVPSEPSVSSVVDVSVPGSSKFVELPPQARTRQVRGASVKRSVRA